MKLNKLKNRGPIIVNATNIGERMSGIGVYSLNLLKAMATMNTDIQFIVYLNKNAKKHFTEFYFPSNFQIRWVSRWLSPDYGFYGHLNRLLFANYLSFKHKRMLVFNTSQLVVNFFRRNQIITIHDVIPLLFKQFHKKQYPYFKYLLKYALRYANKIITPSQHTKQLLQEIYHIPGEKIQVIHNGVPQSEEAYPETIPFTQPYILYVGRVCPMKNISRLIQAFLKLQNHIPHRLVIVGEGLNYIRKEVKAGRLPEDVLQNKRIVFKGHVENKDMRGLYQHADLFVFPSLYEGFGLPPMEAMAYGCPVLVSSAASLPEVCGSAASYIEPENINHLAEGMLKLLKNPTFRNKLVNKGYARVKQYSWHYSAKEHLKILEAQLHSPQATSPKEETKPSVLTNSLK